MRVKIKRVARRHKVTIRWKYVALALVVAALVLPRYEPAKAINCPELKVIFARGSGGERYTSGHYKAFEKAMMEKLNTTRLSYEIDDLDYPAVSIDIGDGHLGTLLGAYVGGGEAYDFGDSVHEGVDRLVEVVNGDACKNTKYVLAGYSQGALVVLNGLERIDPNKIIYAATFGDPKIYLPEGVGPVPAACGGKNLSEYRIYVPDCRAYKGIMGAREPYVNQNYTGKVGTWCNKYDILCSSYYSIKSHTAYAEDGIYEDASRYILSKIGQKFGIKNEYTSPHDTAILIDSTSSMRDLIPQYKDEALRLTKKTLNAGGRVALYDYRDLGDDYQPVERCNFETCNLDLFRKGLDNIETNEGGDDNESLLSASFTVMKRLKWKFGSVKSLVILTDAGYHSPDLDGTTFYDVQKLSKQIDPVNFYIVTRDTEIDTYRPLAEATGGAVVTSLDELTELDDVIMEQGVSLPRVEEEFMDETYDNNLPELKIKSVERKADGSAKISFENTGSGAVVVLNDAVLGITNSSEITVGDLRGDVENKIMLVPISEMRRGEGVEVNLSRYGGGGRTDGGEATDEIGVGASEFGMDKGDEDVGVWGAAKNGGVGLADVVVPKVPNTGRK